MSKATAKVRIFYPQITRMSAERTKNLSLKANKRIQGLVSLILNFSIHLCNLRNLWMNAFITILILLHSEAYVLPYDQTTVR